MFPCKPQLDQIIAHGEILFFIRPAGFIAPLFQPCQIGNALSRPESSL